jgi:hypothetical protein
MNERKDENWLDDELCRAINTTRPEFDAQAWKQNHPEAYQALVGRTRQGSHADLRTSLTARLARAGWMGQLGVAAAIVVMVGLLLTSIRHEPVGPTISPRPATQSPARMVSLMALRTVYHQGGEDGLNQQLDTALKKLGPRPSKLSALQVLSDLES